MTNVESISHLRIACLKAIAGTTINLCFPFNVPRVIQHKLPVCTNFYCEAPTPLPPILSPLSILKHSQTFSNPFLPSWPAGSLPSPHRACPASNSFPADWPPP